MSTPRYLQDGTTNGSGARAQPTSDFFPRQAGGAQFRNFLVVEPRRH